MSQNNSSSPASSSATQGSVPQKVERNRRALTERPLKTSQPTGATLATLGIRNSIPLMHGSQGCCAFAKVYLIQHFREPVPIQNSAVDQIAAVMGADSNLMEALVLLCEKHQPELISVITTGLTEMQGSDIDRVVKEFKAAHPQFSHIHVVTMATPDFVGSMQTGFANGVSALVKQIARAPVVKARRKRQLNLLCSVAMTPADVELLHRYLDAFDLSTIMLPDLSVSMDGHLADDDFSPTSAGGTSVLELEEMASSAATLVFGESLFGVGQWLQQKFAVPCFEFSSLMGMANTDALVMRLAELSGKPVPAWLTRARKRLQDAMLDSHFHLSTAPIAMAMESDMALGYTALLTEQGCEISRLVTATDSPLLARLPIKKIVVGDLSDLEPALDKVSLVIGNTHTANMCEPKLPVLRAGYPCHDRYGTADLLQIGYEGARSRLFAMVNILLAQHQDEVPAHVSRYRFGPETVSQNVAV
ncbi:nitrogenase iron-molybdenum cofactor biosynthesis protein NifN [Corallincola holothuriorum]|uniref:Nitrogenase iron-molybdenum cofactor biosynthesis protein NifN n=1 Tax=Corallincola holothuriorum TaxID=2282215 RepID=A0A368NS64_9GAMM|nr:nitrogenase iron-molybdenum cofactor biosynthesis protein NifN [Corallincola holothuriorum]RCU52514.1 nitrogenase iron-molybdenum cofactor biosynthesis protein NifN [Corallincola holothuriorum]